MELRRETEATHQHGQTGKNKIEAEDWSEKAYAWCSFSGQVSGEVRYYVRVTFHVSRKLIFFF